ncbi:PPE family protein [Mycobacterium kansasii]|uniref:PPE family protein n=1 Tax=Mycobacterium kansasii TaxID=1768 RepID=UPI0004F631A3|nr:PPE family protein [Mycobacterium kansasii]ARG68002.1 PPE family protein [Mycobacterium kansasii]
MFTDFAFLPPEVISTRMYSGPGSGSLQAAAEGWQQLSAELHASAQTYRSVVSDLIAWHWVGPSSAAMAAAATSYAEWLEATAIQTGQTARQAATAASAFDEAFAMTVPPSIVFANREQLLLLIATNFFGQNTSAIAALELAYAEMWVTNSSVMQDYSVTSAAATKLTPFASPQQATTPAGLPGQAAAVAQATAGAAADGGNWLGNLLEQIGMALLPFAPELTPFFLEAGELINAIPFPSIVADDFTFLDGVMAWYATVSSINNISSLGTGIIGAEKNLGILPSLAAPAAEVVPSELAPLVNSVKNVADAVAKGGPGIGEVTAAFRGAGSIGPMSVPPTWTAPAVTTVKTFQGTPLTTLPAGDAGGAGMPGMPGIAPAGTRRGGVVPRYGLTPRVMTRPLSGG